MDRDFALKEWVLDRIIYDLWSPEQISGFLKHRQYDIKSISAESIYSWIYGETPRGKPRGFMRGIKKVSKEDYQETILNHNLTPRKSLNWITPLEAFTQNIHLVALQT